MKVKGNFLIDYLMSCEVNITMLGHLFLKYHTIYHNLTVWLWDLNLHNLFGMLSAF